MRNRGIVVSAVIVFFLGNLCLADVGTDTTNENAELKARIEKLEKELAELKQMVKQQDEARIKEANILERRTANIEQKTMNAKPASGKKPVLSDLDLQIYGRIKVDASYDSSRMDLGDYAKWVRPDRGRNDHSQFDLTANETRLGLLIYGPNDQEFKTSGRVEMDFYGGGTENKPVPMMRHAYLNFEWPQDKFSILAGQTSDVISPLWPDTLNYTVGWWTGNIGYRRPQIRLTKIYSIAKDTDLKLEGAIARTMGRTNSNILAADQSDSGEDAGLPSIQGRVSLTLPSWGSKPATVGFSSHYAKESYDVNAAGSKIAADRKEFDSWSLNLDVQQPVNEWLSFKGEFFTGQDLDAYLGGIGQGVNTVRNKEIRSKGGWAQASFGPWGKWSFNLGVGADKVNADDLVGMTGDRRKYNQSIFGNVLYNFDKNAQIGFELSQWHTEYVDLGDADSVRAQTSFIYKF
ncbi:MAG: DcaP family trimeric outer membrane transporter [Sedimentisphaerales bacterium]